MQKIGLSKSNKNNIKYYKKLIENKSIILDNIKEISSLIIKPQFIDIQYIKNLNQIRLCIKTDLKIIYLKQNDNSLYVYKNYYISYQTIKLPQIIDGHYIKESFILNKLKKEIYTENISAKIINQKVILAYFLVLNVFANPTYYLTYVINNGFGDNVFLSYINGQTLTQKTFYQNANITNLKWDINSTKVWFINDMNKESTICNLESENKEINTINCLNNLVNKNVNNFTNVNNYININKFDILNNNELLIEINTEGKNIYKFNFKRKQINKFIEKEERFSCEKPYYNNLNKVTYFLMGEDESKFLYSIDKNNNVDIIFNYVNIIDYYLSYYLDNIIIKIIKDDLISLFEIDLESKFSIPISLENTYEDIIDAKYLYNLESKKQIIILTKNELNVKVKNTLLLYDFNNYTTMELINGDISKFEIDYESMDIFIILKKQNLNYVEKLNLETFYKTNKTQTILKLPATIKDISVKKVNYAK